MKYGRHRYYPVLALALLLLITSCVPQKKLRYLQYEKATQAADSIAAQAPIHHITPNDLLYIQLFSAASDWNKVPGFDPATNLSTDASIYVQSYPVDMEGNLTLPQLGKHYVKGMTVAQVQALLTEAAREKISLDAEVIAKLINFKVTVIGEVKNPGILQIYDERISVIDALALSGDLTTYGDRTNIMLIRDRDGSHEVYTIDLTDRGLLKSPLFYLQNHDILYVQPLDAKTYGFGQVQWSVIISSISTLIAILAIVYK